MNKKVAQSSGIPNGLPDDFFDSDKKSKKAQEDDLANELEQFEREMAALEAESEEQLKEEFEKLQEEKNLDELDQQIEQWKRIVDLEKRTEELRNKTLSEKPTKKLKTDSSKSNNNQETVKEDDQDLDNIEDFEDKLFDWRSKRL